MTTDIAISREDLDGLQSGLRGTLIRPDDPDYDAARRLWNGLVDKRPAAIVRCDGVADVIAATSFAGDHGLPVAVRGGGHNVAGSAMAGGGLTLDLSQMRSVRVDPVARTVRAEGGATWADVDRQTQAFGLAVPGGAVSDTGIGGLTLGGGMGWMRRSHGLSCDNLLSVDIVTGDGRFLTASEREHADLFWALCGGGQGLGAVTSFEYRAHPLGPEITFCAVFYPYGEAVPILRQVRSFMSGAPDAVNVIAVLGTFPAGSPFPAELHGERFVALIGGNAGPVEEGERAFRPLRELTEPLFDASGVLPYVEAQRFFDEDYPTGDRYYWKSLYLKNLDDAVIEAIVEHGRRAPSERSTIDLWPLGGAIDRPAASGAFAHRGAPYLLGLESNWTDPAADERNIAWARTVWEDMQRFSSGGLYVNFPGFGEGEDFGRAAYGDNHDRLAAVKQRYDSANLFRSTVSGCVTR
jgi:FAD/FMN-containing dehydrogenase